jgi:hypothetical protein
MAVKPCSNRHPGFFEPAQLKRGLCPECSRAYNRERERQRGPVRRRLEAESGRTTQHWRRVKAAAKQLAGYRCERCGAPEDPATGYLHCHLDPRLAGDHRLATVADVQVLCARCHGKVRA